MLVGCSADRPMATPFASKDPGTVETTPSAEGIRAHAHDPSYRHRDWEPVYADPPRIHVCHYPLWWEDEFEDAWGGHDGLHGWTWVDWVAMPGSAGRFLVNTVGWPASAIIHWPGRTMYSDGFRRRPDHEPHDACTYPPSKHFERPASTAEAK
jgi:hypothetical protein